MKVPGQDSERQCSFSCVFLIAAILCGGLFPRAAQAGPPGNYTFRVGNQPGWQMVSAPYTYAQGFTDFGISYVYAFEANSNSYAVSPQVPADTFRLGQGYWAYITQDVSIPATGSPADISAPTQVLLQAGWNQVGNPFVTFIPLSSFSIRFGFGTPVPLPAAILGGTVSPLYAYDNANNQYVAYAAANQTIDPWLGAWLYSPAPATLSISPPQPAGGGAPTPQPSVTMLGANSSAGGSFQEGLGSGPLPVGPGAPPAASAGVVPLNQQEMATVMVTTPAPVDVIYVAVKGSGSFADVLQMAASRLRHDRQSGGSVTYTLQVNLSGAPSGLVTLDISTRTGTVVSQPVSVIVAPVGPGSLTLTGLPPTAPAGSPVNVSVSVRDSLGNPITGYTGTVHLSSSDPAASIPVDYTFTAADAGSHTFSVTFRTAGSQTVTAADTTNNAIAASGVVNIAPASAGGLLLNGFPTPTPAGASSSFTVTAKDAFGNTAAGYTGTVHFTSSDPAAVLPADYTFIAADSGVHSFNAVALRTAGTQSITATDRTAPTITGSETGILVTPGASTHLSINAPNAAVAGAAFNFTITLLDAQGNTATGYTGTLHFSSTDTGAVLPKDYTFTAADAGSHIFSTTLTLAGTQTITAGDIASPGITGAATVTVSAAAAANLVITGFPTAVIAGTPGNLTVTARDMFGNTAATYAGTVHFTSSDQQALIPADYTFATSDAGVHVFSRVSLNTAGTQSITAADTAVGAITGTQSNIQVTAGAAASLVVVAPANTVAGTAFNVTVTAVDNSGNTAAGYTGAVHLSGTGSTTGLPLDYTFAAADNGIHVFPGVTLKTAGTQTITASDSNYVLKSGSAGIFVTAAAVKFLVFSNLSLTAVAGTSSTFTLSAVDSYGNPVPSFADAVNFSSSDRLATLLAAYTFTVSDTGAHVFSVTFKTAGQQSLSAVDPKSDSLHASQTGISVAPGPAAKLSVTGFPSPVNAGAQGSFTVTALDSSGNTATGYRGTIHFTSSDTGASLPANYPFTASDQGTHIFSATLRSGGTQSITATDTITASITGSQTGIVVQFLISKRAALGGVRIEG